MTSSRSYRGPRVIRFGEFELDVRAAELRRGGEKARLQEQPFRLLTMLLDRPGEVVLREEIRKRLWPNDTVVEVSHGINATVLRLREALGDSADDPTYVETVARRGYRFKGRVETSLAAAGPPVESEELTGKTVSHYRVIEKLGSGGMGIVYRAEDLKLGRQVALKLLPRELVSEPAAVARFDREARAASALSHPNICTVYAVEEFAGQPVIVMELIEGQTLEVLLSKGALSVPRSIAIAIQLAGALEAAHAKGIVHRDLKPGNVVLTTGGLKVLDFGLARMDRPTPSGARAPGHVTQEGTILGTPNYMSPEQVQGRTAGEPSDIFSFGLVLYEMLTGRRAFDGLSSADVMAAILTAEPPAMHDNTVPAELQRILRRCLAKNPEERLQSAHELKSALESVATTKDVPAIEPAAPRPRTAFGSFRWWPAAVVVAVVIAAIPVYKWLLHKGLPPRLEVTRFSVPLPSPANLIRLSLAPDGRRIAFVAAGRLFVRSFDALEPRLLYEGENNGTGTPFWSPDGRAIAFAGGGKLRVVDANGGSPSVLCDINTNIAGTWGNDGTILIGVIGDGIYRIPATGGTLTRVTKVDQSRGETRHLLPQFLPEPGRFLYLAASDRPGTGMLYAASLDSAGRVSVMAADSTTIFAPKFPGSPDGYLVSARGRSLLAHAFNARTLKSSGLPVEIATGVSVNPAVGASFGIAHFSVSGSSLAYVSTIDMAGGSPQSRQHSLTVVQNWTAGLR